MLAPPPLNTSAHPQSPPRSRPPFNEPPPLCLALCSHNQAPQVRSRRPGRNPVVSSRRGEKHSPSNPSSQSVTLLRLPGPSRGRRESRERSNVASGTAAADQPKSNVVSVEPGGEPRKKEGSGRGFVESVQVGLEESKSCDDSLVGMSSGDSRIKPEDGVELVGCVEGFRELGLACSGNGGTGDEVSHGSVGGGKRINVNVVAADFPRGDGEGKISGLVGSTTSASFFGNKAPSRTNGSG
mmetsp:Transcript_37134/g.98755  ORF Transcript_37134/g.98755 Transcript_37134/m.98755 type:complete len:240 (-) Transcript_37134:327-1046(-)